MYPSSTDAFPAVEAYAPGARVSDEGVRYSVWAPKHAQLAVRIRRPGGEEEESHAMTAQSEGFFTFDDARGKAGDRYAYELPSGAVLPDPASRFQPEGVHAFSECVDPRAYRWRCSDWQRCGWHGQSIYEIHVGTFTAEGTFCSAIQRLDHVVSLGVEAIEIMPIADFPGERNWGYDGVALFAPARCYGSPDDLRALIDAAHERRLAVILDVVYNHLGPDGNYLGQYSDSYFHAERDTPWGAGFNLDGPNSKPVREFFRSNAAYWLDEYRIDGLRLDATHAMRDDSPRHLLAELAELAHARGAFVIAEDERNTCELMVREDGGGAQIDAVWADDFHHQVRVALTGVQEGYFGSYSGSPEDLAYTVEHGWFYTGQAYASWKGKPRGEQCRHLPSTGFVYCIENHDQVGNRACGERLEHLIGSASFRAASALLCLSPHPPLIFMGQEWAASTPFLYFTDHAGELGRLVSEGRRKEFAAAGINQRLAPEDVPDPQLPETFYRSKLLWEDIQHGPHASTLELYQRCLAQRARWLRGKALERAAWSVTAHERAIAIRYHAADQPERLVVCSLQGEARLSLSTDPSLRPPHGYTWQLDFSSAAEPAGLECPTVGSNGPVEKLSFGSPATVLLVATQGTSNAGLR